MALDIEAVKRDVKNYADDVRQILPVDRVF